MSTDLETRLDRLMRDKRNRAVVVHYAGGLKIRKGKRLTLINSVLGGWPACASNGTTLNLSWERQDITCKRCLSLIAQHDRTAAEDASMPPSRDAKKP